MTAIQTISADQYAIERAICDKAAAYWQAHATFSKSGASSMSADLAKHPDYAACDNAMRGRVEQYELLTATPAILCAYIGKPNANGMGINHLAGQTFPVTTWAGDQIGYATRGAGWSVDSAFGSRMYQFYARIKGREFTGRGFGEGMAIVLRETAASKRGANHSTIYA